MLNEKQVRSIELLISGEHSIQAIADAVGVSRQTLHKWRTENEEYQDEYDKRLQATTGLVTQKFNERLDIAVESLYDIMTDPSVATRERKDAAIYWINRVVGSPTSKQEITDIRKELNITEDDILADIDEIEKELDEE